MQHRIARAAELHALIAAGQEARAPQPRQQTLVRHAVARQRIQHHERRQIFVLAAQAVIDP